MDFLTELIKIQTKVTLIKLSSKIIKNETEQSNFINESNNLLKFQENYRDNDFIIIPRLINCSRNIMIMSYEEGVSYEDLVCDNYQKYKIKVLLFYNSLYFIVYQKLINTKTL